MFWVLTGTIQKHTVLLLYRILTFSFSLTTKYKYSLLSFFPVFFFQLFTYTIHTAPNNSSLCLHSSNESVGHVCGIQVHRASYFPVTYAYCHQRPSSWVSNFLAKYTCCPALHRSCCLFWFCVIIYCLSVSCAPSRKKGLAYVFLPINAQWILLMAEQWGECRACVYISGQVLLSEREEGNNHIWKLYNISMG